MDLDNQVERFREAVAAAGPRGRTTAYPVELRKIAVSYVKARVAAGGSAGGACRELGIGTDTFRRWSAENATSPARATAAFRPVKLAAAAPVAEQQANHVVVHGPGGLRIEGLDVAGLAELLRRLG